MTKAKGAAAPKTTPTPNMDKQGIDSNAGQPQTNSPGGELDKQEAAENSPGAKAGIPTDGEGATGTNGGPGDPGSLENPNDEKAKEVIPGTTLTEEKTEALADEVNPENKNDVVDLGDGRFALLGVHFFKEELDNLLNLGLLVDGKLNVEEGTKVEELKLVTARDLETYHELEKAGVTTADTRKAAVEKLEVYQNADKQNDLDVTKTPGPDSKETNQTPPPQDPPKPGSDKKLYHGDFLNEQQLNERVPVTYDWTEVTAPEHEQYRPTAE